MCFKFWLKCGYGVFHSRRRANQQEDGGQGQAMPRPPYRIVLNEDMNGHQFLMQLTGGRFYPLYDNYVDEDYVNLLIRLRHMEIFDEDVFITGFPKSGVSWVYTLVQMIMDDKSRLPHCSYDRSFVDSMSVDQFETLQNTAPPRLMCSHFTMDSLPFQLHYLKGRTIYVVRNFKDVLLSMFEWLPTLQKVLTYRGTWEAYLDLELHGNFCYGSWFDHIQITDHYRDHYPASRIHVILYEHLKTNPIGEIGKLCRFLEKPDHVSSTLAELTRFDFMKEHEECIGLDVWSSGLCRPGSPGILRRGMVGEWRNQFDHDQNLKVNKVFLKVMKRSPIGRMIRPFLGIPSPNTIRKAEERERDEQGNRRRNIGDPVPPLEIIYGPEHGATPRTSRQAVPGTSREPVPRTSRQAVAGTNREPVPGTSRQVVPGTSRQVVPGTSRDVPGTSREPVPGTSREPVPGTSREPVPGTSREPVPGTSRQPVPGTSRGPVPGTSREPVPGTSREPVPGTSREPVPGTSKQAVPGTSSEVTFGTSSKEIPGSSKGTRKGGLPGKIKKTIPGKSKEAVPGKSKEAIPGTNKEAIPGTYIGAILGKSKSSNQEALQKAIQCSRPAEDERKQEEDTQELANQEIFWDARETLPELEIGSQQAKAGNHTKKESNHTFIDVIHTTKEGIIKGTIRTTNGATCTTIGSTYTSKGSSLPEIEASHTTKNVSHSTKDATHTTKDAVHTTQNKLHKSKAKDAVLTTNRATGTTKSATHTNDGSAVLMTDLSDTSNETSHTTKDAIHAPKDTTNPAANKTADSCKEGTHKDIDPENLIVTRL